MINLIECFYLWNPLNLAGHIKHYYSLPSDFFLKALFISLSNEKKKSKIETRWFCWSCLQTKSHQTIETHRNKENVRGIHLPNPHVLDAWVLPEVLNDIAGSWVSAFRKKASQILSLSNGQGTHMQALCEFFSMLSSSLSEQAPSHWRFYAHWFSLGRL